MARLRRLEPGQNDVTDFAFEPGALAMLRFRVFCTENTCKVLCRGVPGTVLLAERGVLAHPGALPAALQVNVVSGSLALCYCC